jgi:hypothetical protein
MISFSSIDDTASAAASCACFDNHLMDFPTTTSPEVRPTSGDWSLRSVANQHCAIKDKLPSCEDVTSSSCREPADKSVAVVYPWMKRANLTNGMSREF